MRNVKKLIALLCLLALALCCAACGKEETVSTRPLSEIYAEMEQSGVLPRMLRIDGDLAMDFYGIELADCTEAVLMVSSDSMLADEVVLLRAKDQATADACKVLLDERMAYKAAEAEGYSPEQFAIIKQGKVLQSGTDLALIVSLEVEKLLDIYKK